MQHETFVHKLGEEDQARRQLQVQSCDERLRARAGRWVRFLHGYTETYIVAAASCVGGEERPPCGHRRLQECVLSVSVAERFASSICGASARGQPTSRDSVAVRDGLSRLTCLTFGVGGAQHAGLGGNGA